MAEFLTLEEAARALGISVSDLEGLVARGEIASVSDEGGLKFRQSDLDAYSVSLDAHGGLPDDADSSIFADISDDGSSGDDLLFATDEELAGGSNGGFLAGETEETPLGGEGPDQVDSVELAAGAIDDEGDVLSGDAAGSENQAGDTDVGSGSNSGDSSTDNLDFTLSDDDEMDLHDAANKAGAPMPGDTAVGSTSRGGDSSSKIDFAVDDDLHGDAAHPTTDIPMGDTAIGMDKPAGDSSGNLDFSLNDEVDLRDVSGSEPPMDVPADTAVSQGPGIPSNDDLDFVVDADATAGGDTDKPPVGETTFDTPGDSRIDVGGPLDSEGDSKIDLGAQPVPGESSIDLAGMPSDRLAEMETQITRGSSKKMKRDDSAIDLGAAGGTLDEMPTMIAKKGDEQGVGDDDFELTDVDSGFRLSGKGDSATTDLSDSDLSDLSDDDHTQAVDVNPDASHTDALDLDEDDDIFGDDDDEITARGPESGINLSSPIDSGVGLGDESVSDSEFDLNLEDSGEESFSSDEFEVGFKEDDSSPALAGDSDVDLEAEEEEEEEIAAGEEGDFELAIDESADEEDEESGSEVVAIDEDEDDFAAVEEDVDEDEEEEEYEDEEDYEEEDEVMVAPAAASAPWPSWTVFLLAFTIVPMCIAGIMSFELMRSAWSYQEPYAIDGSVIEMVGSVFGKS
ncbi:Helix-turn-helix domain protein [Planctomycetes bacterium Pan216]|uniref:Helix-turn-helix domain protein n=1 Tax=Kolteria novifilia TaxID=2527975 RepID=A0A518B946_9BACT|nr:Helix-turn-helix domain protein [Planctomycetes bacterium Pan216]